MTSEWSPNKGLDYKVLNQTFHNHITKHHKWQQHQKTKVTQWIESTLFLIIAGWKGNILLWIEAPTKYIMFELYHREPYFWPHRQKKKSCQLSRTLST